MDPEGLEELARLHGPFLLQLARERLKRSGGAFLQAEDAVQDVWAALLAREDPPPSPVRPYLAASVLNAIRLRLRGQSRASSRERARPLGRSPEAPEEPLMRKEGEEGFSRALSELPWEDRMLLHWIYWDGLPYSRVAVLAGLPPNSLGPALTRARGRLRERLEKSPRNEGLPA